LIHLMKHRNRRQSQLTASQSIAVKRIRVSSAHARVGYLSQLHCTTTVFEISSTLLVTRHIRLRRIPGASSPRSAGEWACVG
jgi:hypothetical protein